MKGLGQLMQQAQQMRKDMQKAQDELASLEVTGEAGGGMVKVLMTCKHVVRRLDIEDSLFTDDKKCLRSLLQPLLTMRLERLRALCRRDFPDSRMDCRFPWV